MLEQINQRLNFVVFITWIGGELRSARELRAFRFDVQKHRPQILLSYHVVHTRFGKREGYLDRLVLFKSSSNLLRFCPPKQIPEVVPVWPKEDNSTRDFVVDSWPAPGPESPRLAQLPYWFFRVIQQGNPTCWRQGLSSLHGVSFSPWTRCK